MDRTEDTEDDVDFRPRSPAEDRLTVDLGVRGEGDNDCRLYDVASRGGGIVGDARLPDAVRWVLLPA